MQNLAKALRAFDRCGVAVIGDLMLDEYLWGHIERISPEAPVPILNVVRREWTLGGAGNVVENLRSLGVQVAAVGVVGQDDTGERVSELLKTHGVDVSGIVTDPKRKSTRKARLMSLEHGQQVFRLDEESNEPVQGDLEERLISKIRAVAGGVQAILCSDYMKGVLTGSVLSATFAAARERGIVSIVGPKDSRSRKYYGANILMPNSRELSQLVGTPMNGNVWLTDSARRLTNDLDLEALLVTRGSEGMSLFETTADGFQRMDIATVARSVYDVTGAGDTALATFSAAIGVGLKRETAAYLANVAAGIKVGKRGTAPVTAAEVQNRILEETASRGEEEIEASRLS